MTSLTDRTTLVTGASEGIGLATAEAFARAGASLVVLARDASRLASAAEMLRSHGGVVRTLEADLSDESALARALGALDEPIDILVNNLGLAVLFSRSLLRCGR